MAERLVITQLHFEELEPLLPVPDGGKTIEERFQAFHDTNPHVFRYLVNIALYLKETGVTHYSMKAIYERLRFASIETTGEPYKLDNSFTALYARKAMAEIPELVEFFELRERTSASGEEVN